MKIAEKIKEVANHRLSGKYNLAQYQEGGVRHNERIAAETHKRVCEQIVAFMAEHTDIPLYFVLSVGISKGAYKESEFNKGYKSFNAAKVLTIAQMGAAYNAYNGVKGKMSDVTIRLMMRYYEKRSTSISDFMTDLNNSQVLGKICGSRDIEYYKLCHNLNIPITISEKDKDVVAA